jgi:hypothetical protein
MLTAPTPEKLTLTVDGMAHAPTEQQQQAAPERPRLRRALRLPRRRRGATLATTSAGPRAEVRSFGDVVLQLGLLVGLDSGHHDHQFKDHDQTLCSGATAAAATPSGAVHSSTNDSCVSNVLEGYAPLWGERHAPTGEPG